jgi:hypothetical protein
LTEEGLPFFNSLTLLLSPDVLFFNIGFMNDIKTFSLLEHCSDSCTFMGHVIPKMWWLEISLVTVSFKVITIEDTRSAEKEVSIFLHIMWIGGRTCNPLPVPHVIELQWLNHERQILLDIGRIEENPFWPLRTFMNSAKSRGMIILK